MGETAYGTELWDEIRISTIARSADWIKTSYNNQANLAISGTPGTPEDVLGEGILPHAAHLSVPDGTTNFSVVPDLFDVGNMVLATSATTVSWTGFVSASGNDYDSNIKMGSQLVSINVSALDTTINNMAVITMNGVDCAYFNLYYATGFHPDAASLIAAGTRVATQDNVGGNCADATKCTNVQCSGGFLTFTAQHFDGFGEQNDPPVPEFGTWAIMLALGLVVTGVMFIKKGV